MKKHQIVDDEEALFDGVETLAQLSERITSGLNDPTKRDWLEEVFLKVGTYKLVHQKTPPSLQGARRFLSTPIVEQLIASFAKEELDSGFLIWSRHLQGSALPSVRFHRRELTWAVKMLKCRCVPP